MTRKDALHSACAEIQWRIRRACEQAKRDAQAVRLLAVSKTKPASDIRALYGAGVTQFGENYLQEALDKIAALSDLAITWHYIGAIQSNKTQAIASAFDWVHTIDRDKIARRLDAGRSGHASPLHVLIQVNVDEAPTKSGVAPSDLDALIETILTCPNLRLRGLMSIPDPVDAEALGRAHHTLKTLFDASIVTHGLPDSFDTLSMGMTQDLELAIAEGSTLVRIGTALFGARQTRETP